MKKYLIILGLLISLSGFAQDLQYTNLRLLLNKVNELSTNNDSVRIIVNESDNTITFWKGTIQLIVAGASLPSYPIYYVSNDGDDGEDGLTPATAWETIAKVNATSLAPGTKVCFNKGDTWRETLTVSSSGNADAYNVFSSYGNGDDPKILGSAEVTSWTLSHGNVWYSYDAAYIDPYSLSYDGNIFFKETDDDISWGRVKKANWGTLAQEYDWAWTLDTLYIYSPTDPNTRYDGIEMAQRLYAININDKEYITFDGLEVAYVGSYGISDYYPPSNLTGLTIKNCHIHHINIKGGLGAHGIEAWHSNMLIQNNVIHDCGRRNISINIYIGSVQISNIIIEGNTLYNGFHTTGVDLVSTSVGTIDDVIIRNNYIYDDPSGVLDQVESIRSTGMYIAEESTGDLTNIYIYNNVFQNTSGRGILLDHVTSSYVYNNTFYGVNPNLATAGMQFILFDNGANCVLENNIFYNNVDPVVNVTFSCIWVTASAGTVTSDYNLFYCSDANGRMIYWIDTAYKMANWATYKAAKSQDANSPVPADPAFTDITDPTYDFHLLLGSPAINTGTSGGGIPTTDYYGNPRVGATDIGAIEKQ